MAEASSAPVVVITGASAGIGAALARELAGRHASLVLIARREELLLEMAATLGTAVEVVPGDVTRRADVERVLERAVARFGGVDVWVNNAGRGISRPSVEAIGEGDLEVMLRDNTRSALHGMQVVLPHFKARGKGVLVNVTSMLSRVSDVPFRAAYSASKAALTSLTESLRAELAKDFPGIRVVLALPGVVATDFGTNAIGGGPDSDSRSIPGAQPVEEVARVIADGLFSGPVDVYTRPAYFEKVLGYLRRLAGSPG
jgi:short-subunit dehydrogenase